MFLLLYLLYEDDFLQFYGQDAQWNISALITIRSILMSDLHRIYLYLSVLFNTERRLCEKLCCVLFIGHFNMNKMANNNYIITQISDSIYVIHLNKKDLVLILRHNIDFCVKPVKRKMINTSLYMSVDIHVNNTYYICSLSLSLSLSLSEQ